MTEIVLATHNAGKIREFEQLFADKDVTLSIASDYNLKEPEETGTSFEDNARIKAEYVSQATGKIAIADDSGLEVEALNGAPGVYTANWAETNNGRDYAKAFARLEQELQSTKAPYKANFTSVICLARPNGETEFFRGEVHGQLIFPPRGENGFGYDPIFIPNGYDQSFGELTECIKAQISHRAQAFSKFKSEFSLND